MTARIKDLPPTVPDPERDGTQPIDPGSPQAFLNRELSWLGFAQRVIAQIERGDLPLLERVRFAGIAGMLHDEFFMKRMSGLKRQIARGRTKTSVDGRTPDEEFAACRAVLIRQVEEIGRALREDLRPAMRREGFPIQDVADLEETERARVRAYFRDSVMPILTPLTVDAEHPFPFISNFGLNLAVLLPDPDADRPRFVRIKVPDNRPRWIPVEGGGWVPLEQVIAANLDLMYPGGPPVDVRLFRVTRGAEGDVERSADLREEDPRGGSIVRQVSRELKARRFAGVVRLQVDPGIDRDLCAWLCDRLGITEDDVYPTDYLLGLSDLSKLKVPDRPDLAFPEHRPATHPRLQSLPEGDTEAIFEVVRQGDLLLHHPYHGFDDSVLRFIESAAVDPDVLAIKLTIYRTSSDSPIVRALAEASRRGKQVAVLVEITARFDEAPNIAWGQYLEQEGVHVAYGVERLKTHVKLALVVREERDGIRRYAHIGTGNYHTGTARIYEDLGVLTADPALCEEVASVFNTLTGTTAYPERGRMLVAPVTMRDRFTDLIRRESEHARAGRPSGIDAKMNQLQDVDIIRELYEASRAGVPIRLNVRGLCCLRPGVPGLSETVRVFGVIGRFLEHSRIYRFRNGGDPEYFLGSADWMKRNLSNRVETIAPVLDVSLQRELDAILEVYERDNASVWDCDADGRYVLRRPAAGEPTRAAQDVFARRAAGGTDPDRDGARAETGVG